MVGGREVRDCGNEKRRETKGREMRRMEYGVDRKSTTERREKVEE